MADLSTNYIDDILAESMNGKRKYRITRAEGSFEEVTLEDISEYEQIGSVFGAGDINRTNQAVNEKFDSGDVVDPMETTVPGFAADALAVKNQFNEQNKNLQWYIDNGFLLNPNDICQISVHNNRCQIVRNGCYVKNGICYIDLLIITNISGDTPLNSEQAYTLILGLPQRRDSGMLTLKSSDGTFGIQDSRIFVSKCSNNSVYQINGWYYISN